MKKLALILALLGAPAGAQDISVFFSGNELLEMCRSDNAAARADCMGYITGASDVLSGVISLGDMKAFCEPASVTRGQIHDVVVRYAIENPENRHFSGGALVYSALLDAFPC